MTYIAAECPVCGIPCFAYWKQTLAGGMVLSIAAHYPDNDPEACSECWGSVRELGLEDIRAAAMIAEREGDRLRLAAHP